MVSFNYTPQRKYDAEELTPLSGDLIARALHSYGQLQRSKYLPQQLEAEIFSKEIGPIAALASSPTFTGFSPEVRDQIAGRIAKYLGAPHQNPTEMSSQPTPGYPSDEELYQNLSKGADIALGPGGKTKVGSSQFAVLAQKYGLPDIITEKLGGTKPASEAASFEPYIAEAVQKLKFKGYSEVEARKILTPQVGETNESYKKRIKHLFVGESPQKESSYKEPKGLEAKIAQDEQERADAEATAEKFNTTPEMVLLAQSQGVKTGKEFREFLKRNQ